LLHAASPSHHPLLLVARAFAEQRLIRLKSDDQVEHDGDIMKIPGAKDSIDEATFEQILEMDDDEDEREFSKSIVYDFFTQAESTFEKMDANL
jgi:hypothetical protein